MSEIYDAFQKVIAREGVAPFQVPERAIPIIESFSSVPTLEKNLLIRCAQYQMYPEAVFENESAANRNAQRIATALIKRHGIEEKAANSIAVEICTSFARDGIRINVLQDDRAPSKSPTIVPQSSNKDEKPKKKGLFSFFKKG